MGQRIVIIGGGFGGAFTARYLRKYAERDSQIELINSKPRVRHWKYVQEKNQVRIAVTYSNLQF